MSQDCGLKSLRSCMYPPNKRPSMPHLDSQMASERPGIMQHIRQEFIKVIKACLTVFQLAGVLLSDVLN